MYKGFHETGQMTAYLDHTRLRLDEGPRDAILPLYRGLYMRQLASWFSAFPRERFYFMQSEALFKQPQTSVDSFTDWLGLPRGPRLGEDRLGEIWLRRSQCDISAIFTEGEQGELRRFYKNENAGLAEVAGFEY